jgi:Ca-activated chloride channel homolog
VLSDGKPNRGLTSATQLAGYVRSLGMAASALGFGGSFDEDVLDAIAAAGSGRYSYIREPASARSDLARAVDAQAGVVAEEIELHLRPSPGVEVVQVLPSSPLRFGNGELSLAVGDVFIDEARALAVEMRFDLGADSLGRLLDATVSGKTPGSNDRHTVSATLDVDLRAGDRTIDRDSQREVALLQADATRLAARALADGGAMPSAAAELRRAIARIDALPGFVTNDASPLAELREELADLVAKYERRTTRMERVHHRKAAVAYKPASPFFERTAREAPATPAQVVGTAGPVNGRVFALWSDTIIGRSPRCDIAIDHPTISRNHARIQFIDSQFVLVDLGATTGTLVNGRSVQSSRLVEGDVIQLGDAVVRF